MKLNTLLFAFGFLLFFGCSKNNSDETLSIMGKWNYKETIINGVTFPYDDHELCGKDYIEFFNENEVKSVDIFECEAIVDWTGTYSKNGNALTILNGENAIVSQIIEFTPTKLSFKFNYDNDGDGVLEETILVLDK